MSLRCSSKDSPLWITSAFPTIFSNSDGNPASRGRLDIPPGKAAKVPKRLGTGLTHSPSRGSEGPRITRGVRCEPWESCSSTPSPGGGEAALLVHLGFSFVSFGSATNLRVILSRDGTQDD